MEDAHQGILESSPVQAVVAFVLGPLLSMPDGALQSAYASDALSFISQQLESLQAQESNVLSALSTGDRLPRHLSNFVCSSCIVYIKEVALVILHMRSIFILRQSFKQSLTHSAILPLHAGLLQSALAAVYHSDEQKGSACGSTEISADLLAALMQLPIAGVSVLRAAASALRKTIESLADSSR